ncbi:hypothetical protein [Armatimonas sp.]|uniref:hypothetical protein n=1 Tax=Armatimonas sp. TaxID=1872638 RepID=UPI0037505B21
MTSQSLLSERIKRLGAFLASVALLNLFLSYRLGRTNDWLLDVPVSAGNWEAIDTPLSQDFLTRLSLPKVRGVAFKNPLDDEITCQLIAVRSFESYREPDVFFPLSLTAQRKLTLFGADNPLRAWVLKVPRGNGRLLVYSWLQSPSGKTYLYGEQGIQQGFPDRLRLGWATIWNKEPLCLVRLYMLIPPTDKNGAQARRSLDTVALSLYKQNLGNSK